MASHAGLAQLFFQRCAHAIEFQSAQLGQGGMRHHCQNPNSLLVVARPADTGVVGADPVAGHGLAGLVAVVAKNVAHVAVLTGTDLQGQCAGRFEPRLAVALRQRQQAEAGAIAVFRVFVLFQQAGHHDGGGGTDVAPQ